MFEEVSGEVSEETPEEVSEEVSEEMFSKTCLQECLKKGPKCLKKCPKKCPKMCPKKCLTKCRKMCATNRLKKCPKKFRMAATSVAQYGCDATRLRHKTAATHEAATEGADTRSLQRDMVAGRLQHTATAQRMTTVTGDTFGSRGSQRRTVATQTAAAQNRRGNRRRDATTSGMWQTTTVAESQRTAVAQCNTHIASDTAQGPQGNKTNAWIHVRCGLHNFWTTPQHLATPEQN